MFKQCVLKIYETKGRWKKIYETKVGLSQKKWDKTQKEDGKLQERFINKYTRDINISTNKWRNENG